MLYISGKRSEKGIISGKMSAMVKCQHCDIQLREDRCKKHHAKVHSNFPFNLMYYKEDIELITHQTADEVDGEKCENKIVEKLTPSNVEHEMEKESVHVRCEQCQNIMPADAIGNHVKRKHSPGPSVSSYPSNVAFLLRQEKKAEPFRVPFMTMPPKTFDNETESLYNIQVTADQLLKLFRQQKVYSKHGTLRLTDF